MSTRKLVTRILAITILSSPFLLSAAEWASGWQASAEARKRALPTRSSPIAITHDDDYVWSVNPDNDSVSVFRVQNDRNIKVAQIAVDKEPWCVAITPDDEKAYVTNMASGTVSVISTVQPARGRHHQGGNRAVWMRADARRPAAVRHQPVVGDSVGDQHETRRGHRDHQGRG